MNKVKIFPWICGAYFIFIDVRMVDKFAMIRTKINYSATPGNIGTAKDINTVFKPASKTTIYPNPNKKCLPFSLEKGNRQSKYSNSFIFSN